MDVSDLMNNEKVKEMEEQIKDKVEDVVKDKVGGVVEDLKKGDMSALKDIAEKFTKKDEE